MIRTLDYTIGLTNARPDDEYDVTYSLEKVLEKRGFEVDGYTDPKNGII
jgi:hypothetical protein